MRLFALLLLLLAAPANADMRMESMLQQGLSAYEVEQYTQALGHFTAALSHALVHGESTMYPAAYLCAIWYFGRGVDADPLRADTACALVRGDKSDFQLQLFQQSLASNAEADGIFPFQRGMTDAAAALAWYLKK